MRTSETLAKIAPDLVIAIGELEGVAKTADNDAFKKNGKALKYATLEACVDATREILAKHGLCVVQAPGEVQEKVLIVTTRLLHKSGEWIESDFHMPITQWTPQAAGSATTYARRYALMAALNLAPVEDDDGSAASAAAPPARPEPKRADPKPPTLTERAGRFAATLKGVKSAEDLRKAYDLGAKLCAELDEKDPERLVEINALYEARFAELSERRAA